MISVSFGLTAGSWHNKHVYLHTFWHLPQTAIFLLFRCSHPPRQNQVPGEPKLLAMSTNIERIID